MGKEMKKYHEVVSIALELTADGKLSWKEAIEKAKRFVLEGQDIKPKDKILQKKNTLL